MTSVKQKAKILTAGVSVVVPSYRRSEDLRRCLSGLSRQTLAPAETIVVLRPDDGPSRAVVEQQSGEVRIVDVHRPGQVAALNAGCAAARTELIAITDDDAVPRPDWVRAIAARFAGNPRIGAVGGRDVVHFGDFIDGGKCATVGRVRPWGRVIGNHHLQSQLQDVHFLKGANMSLRAGAWRPFDEFLLGDGPQVCNDMEATYSVHRRGWRVVYDPEVIVDHYPAERLNDDKRAQRSFRAEQDELHNQMYVMLRHAAWWHRPIVFAYHLLIGTRVAPGVLLAALPGLTTANRERARGIGIARLSAVRSLRQHRGSADGTRSGQRAPQRRAG